MEQRRRDWSCQPGDAPGPVACRRPRPPAGAV